MTQFFKFYQKLQIVRLKDISQTDVRKVHLPTRKAQRSSQRGTRCFNLTYIMMMTVK